MARVRESRRRYARASARGRRGFDSARSPILAGVLHTKRRFLGCFVGRRDCSRAREWHRSRGTRNVVPKPRHLTLIRNALLRYSVNELYPLQTGF